MIRVKAQPEPDDFHKKVREKGQSHMAKHGINPSKPLPPKTELPPFWRACLGDLYRSYGGICGYLCVHFEIAVGGGTVEHFVAKSSYPGEAYEWSNCRLACSIMNSRKRAYDDVLDPFEVRNAWFHLELVTGRIYPNPKISQVRQERVKATIERLGLDDGGNKELRARHYQEYREGQYDADFLRRRSPFVWAEAKRQKAL